MKKESLAVYHEDGVVSLVEVLEDSIEGDFRNVRLKSIKTLRSSNLVKDIPEGEVWVSQQRADGTLHEWEVRHGRLIEKDLK